MEDKEKGDSTSSASAGGPQVDGATVTRVDYEAQTLPCGAMEVLAK
jgi:hypothetical protein